MRRGQFYAFTVLAEEEIPLPDHYLIIEPGLNTFTAVVEDLDAFTRMLAEGKAVVQEAKPIGHVDPAADDLLTFDLPKV